MSTCLGNRTHFIRKSAKKCETHTISIGTLPVFNETGQVFIGIRRENLGVNIGNIFFSMETVGSCVGKITLETVVLETVRNDGKPYRFSSLTVTLETTQRKRDVLAHADDRNAAGTTCQPPSDRTEHPPVAAAPDLRADDGAR